MIISNSIKKVEGLSLIGMLSHQCPKLKLVYTPLHGAGINMFQSC